MADRTHELRDKRSSTKALSLAESKALFAKCSPKPRKSDAGKRKVRVVEESVEINGEVYTHKTFIPLESKTKRFLKKLNKK